MSDPSAPASSHGDTRACPFCAETIKAAAIKCRFCGAEIAQPKKGATNRSSESSSLSPLAVTVIAVIAAAGIGYAVIGHKNSSDPESQRRWDEEDAIASCWQRQRSAELDSQRQHLSGGCSALERQYTEKYRRPPP